jgi:putative ABC transport system permease protein
VLSLEALAMCVFGLIPMVLEILEEMLKPLPTTSIVVMVVVLSFFHKLGLGWETIYSITRSFFQLSIIGFVLQFTFT